MVRVRVGVLGFRVLGLGVTRGSILPHLGVNKGFKRVVTSQFLEVLLAAILGDGAGRLIWNLPYYCYPCSGIGSQRCNLFANRTIFCSKSHLFLSQ